MPHYRGARAGAAGDLDPTFGVGGIVTTAGQREQYARAVVVQPDGKIVIAGSAGLGEHRRVALVRYLPDGSIDTAFGTTGRVSIGFGDDLAEARALVLQSDGELVAAGTTRVRVSLLNRHHYRHQGRGSFRYLHPSEAARTQPVSHSAVVDARRLSCPGPSGSALVELVARASWVWTTVSREPCFSRHPTAPSDGVGLGGRGLRIPQLTVTDDNKRGPVVRIAALSRTAHPGHRVAQRSSDGRAVGTCQSREELRNDFLGGFIGDVPLAHHERGCTRKQKRATQARQAFATSTVAQRF